MTSPTPKQLLGTIALLVVAALGTYFYKDAMLVIWGVAAVGAAALLVAGGGAAAESLGGLSDAVRRAASGDRTSAPDGASEQLQRVFDELARFADRRKKDSLEVEARRAEAARSEEALEEVTTRLSVGVSAQIDAGEETARLIKELTTAIREIAQHVETLASSAEESSSSILEMTATNDEVAENVGELAGSVRETVSSIEEMAYSIKEVAKNVDALSLTAEETSSSMNEMDVSIDQVQSNANETARLSEEVALDAEKGAEAILKTISEIYRIKESSQEAVAVISNLGSRIEAIGQIVNVIDDVAEQTNLLALIAAIIAAQAGEQG